MSESSPTSVSLDAGVLYVCVCVLHILAICIQLLLYLQWCGFSLFHSNFLF